MKTQREFPTTSGVFNLVQEIGTDGERIFRERLQADARRREAEDYQRKMQRLFDEHCPGFVGGAMPSGEQGHGEVLIESGCAKAAVDWLKRRFRVKTELEMSLTGELKVTFATRRKPVKGCGRRRVGVSFAPVEQYELGLGGSDK